MIEPRYLEAQRRDWRAWHAGLSWLAGCFERHPLERSAVHGPAVPEAQ